MRERKEREREIGRKGECLCTIRKAKELEMSEKMSAADESRLEVKKQDTVKPTYSGGGGMGVRAHGKGSSRALQNIFGSYRRRVQHPFT